MSDNQSLLDAIEHIRLVQSHLGQLADRLNARARMHDQSKLQEPELSGYAGLSEAVKGLPYGTDKYRLAFEPFKAIIKHHYEANDHHPEHFPGGVNDMTLLQLIEMFCDWKAASMRNTDEMMQSINISVRRFGIDEQLARILCNTAIELDW